MLCCIPDVVYSPYLIRLLADATATTRSCRKAVVAVQPNGRLHIEYTFGDRAMVVDLGWGHRMASEA